MLGSAFDVPQHGIVQPPEFLPFYSSGSIGRSNESRLCGFAVIETDLGSMRVCGDRRLGKGLDLQKYLPES
jgi:hypothetical protein